MNNVSGSQIIVGFLLYPNVTLMDFVGASEVFAFTGGIFKPIWISTSELPVKTSEGLSVMPSYSFKNSPKIDILFILEVVQTAYPMLCLMMNYKNLL